MTRLAAAARPAVLIPTTARHRRHMLFPSLSFPSLVLLLCARDSLGSFTVIYHRYIASTPAAAAASEAKHAYSVTRYARKMGQAGDGRTARAEVLALKHESRIPGQ